MGKYDKDYDAFQIFEQIQGQEETVAAQPLPLPRQNSRPNPRPNPQPNPQPNPRPSPQPHLQPLPLEPVRPSEAAASTQPPRQTVREEAPYYEIEYDSCPMPGVGRFVLKSAKIEEPPQERDEVREVFNRMRDIARESRSLYFSNTKFYDRRIQQENSGIFYRQGMFMKDFEDEYEDMLPYSAYYPNYQMMGYGQLRTYFTWRTQVRQGNIQQTSLSYAYLYIYELLNNIGVETPGEGLERLMLFWDAYRVYDQSIDKYVLKWLKDYHIYYELPLSFHQFIEENGLAAQFPNLSNPEDRFDLCCAISKYDIRKSGFYTDDRKEMVRECFAFTYARLQQAFAENRMDLDKSIFQPTKHMAAWLPFKEALFYPALQQADRRVVLSEKEIYLCAGNQWTFSTSITTESGKQLLGYAFKQMESVLRSLTKYRHKLTANMNSLSPMMADELRKAGISLETVIAQAVTEFYREATRTVVRVDRSALDRIREESLATQEKLVVPEQEVVSESVSSGVQNSSALDERKLDAGITTVDSEEADLPASNIEEFDSKKTDSAPCQEAEPNPWEALNDLLTDTEKEALALAINGETNIKQFADAHGIMLEVLMDGINEKSMDCIGDSLLDDEFTIYDDYIEQVKGMVETI